MQQVKFYKYTNKNMVIFLMCMPTKTIFPDTNTQTNIRKQIKPPHPSFVYLCIRVRAEKITALEKP